MRSQICLENLKEPSELISLNVNLLQYIIYIYYVHCYRHFLNLALVKSCFIQPVYNAFGIVEEFTPILFSHKRIDIFNRIVI